MRIICVLRNLILPVLPMVFLGGPAAAGIPEQISWQRSFDDQDRLSKLVDPAGRETSFTYSTGPNGSLSVTKTPPEGSKVIWKFDDLGRRKSMTDSAGTVTYGYDDHNRVNRVQRKGLPCLAYTYDTLDRVISLRVGDFYELDYTYDFLGRLKSMKTPAGTITYKYLTGQGLLVRTLPNGVETIWEFEPNGQLRKITHANAKRIILAEYTYEYRPDGLLAAIGERSSRGEFATSYEYDRVGRLIRAADQSGMEYCYEYDQVGNRLRAILPNMPSQVCTYDWAGRLIKMNDKSCTHDTVGNLTSMMIDESKMQYRHNPDGQLLKANGKVSYQYDGEGRLIERKVGEAKTTIIPNPFSEYWQPLVMENSSSDRTLLVWDGNTPLIMIRNGKPEYMLHDHLGSVRLVADDQGKVMQRIDYDPYGTMKGPATSTDFAPRFAGLFWDAGAQAYLTLARAYAPATGRFLGTDPQLSLPNDSKHHHSVYAYCGGDPVNFVDRNGAEAEKAKTDWPNPLWLPKEPPNWFKNILYKIRPPSDIDQRFDHNGEAKRWFVNTLNSYEHEALQSSEYSHKDMSKLTREQRIEIRKIAVNRFVENYSDYPAHRIGRGRSRKYLSDFQKYVANMNIKTEDGWVSMDWLTTLISVKNKQPLITRIASIKPEDRWSFNVALHRPDLAWLPFLFTNDETTTSDLYIFGKTYHNRISPWRGEKKWPEKGNEFPASNWNAVRFVDEVYNPDRSFASLVFAPRGIAGISVHASSRPLTTAEYTAWKKSQREPASRSTRRDWEDLFDNGGGGWGGGGPGGPGGPGSSGGGSWGGHGGPGGGSGLWSNRMSPSTVGGVYLGGAGQALDGIGQIKGVALDANNNLILLSKTGDEISLPPLRLDDVVTIFRSVYIYGQGPTVTIDPSPENPEGSAMIIRHGKATENTYVGWILYQADRLMKGYTIGVDNITAKDVTSVVPGYAEVIDTLYFGDDTPEKSRQTGHWERFWIVPAGAHRYDAACRDLTLFDVPLKVKTQVMKWEKGKLVDDPRGKSSAGALKFIKWFTKQYDSIAHEQYLTPPPESGVKGPVPVFAELRRIALMTALAEKLRDHGTTMPFWMRDYEIRPVPFEKFTPGLQVTRSNGKVRAQVYGGVALSPESKDIKQFAAAPDLEQLPKPDRKHGKEILKRSNALSTAVRETVTSAEPLKLHKLSVEGDTYHALSMPGSMTRALAPCRLEEVDMVVPIEGGREIRLARSYHSFFEPLGPWGKGWALDLPRLEQIQVPIERKGSAVRFRKEYELITPLNNIYARFSEVKKVPALNNSRLQVPNQDCEFFGLVNGKPAFLKVPTLKLLCKNGGAWHFTKAGDLAAVDKDGFRTVFIREPDGKVSQIAGLLGTHLMATIDLRYDAHGRLAGATGKNTHGEQTISYEYNPAGKLARVVSDQGKLGYQYQGPWVSTVTWQDSRKTADGKLTPAKTLNRFEYNNKGQMIAEFVGDGERVAYNVTSGHQGNTVTVTRSGKTGVSEVTRYDTAYRPVEARYADGTIAAWKYPKSGGSVLKLKYPEGEVVKVTETADRRRRTLDIPNLPQVIEDYDKAGRLVALSENSRNVLRQHWYPDGNLQTIEIENQTTRPQYDKDGLMTGVIISPPGEKDQLKHWQETKLDIAGRPVEITDNRGLRIAVRYDNQGDVSQMITKRNGKNYGFNMSRDDAGRIRTVKSSWGKKEITYDKEGALSMVTVQKQGRTGPEQSVLEFVSGRLLRAKQFDGGEMTILYHSEGPGKDLPRQVTCANGLNLNYHYNSSAGIASVDVGNQRRIALDYDAKGRIIGYTHRPGNNRL